MSKKREIIETQLVVHTARKIVNQFNPSYGLSDAGDVLVAYLKKEIDTVEAIASLCDLEVGYRRDKENG